MMCVSPCGRVYSVLGMTWSNWLVPYDLCKHYRDWVLPPANDTPSGGSTVLPMLKHLNLWARGHTLQPSVVPKTKNTTFSNVIMLLCVSLKLVHSHLFRSRRGGNYICICVSLCGVVMPQVHLILGFSFFFVVGGCHGRVGGVRTVISHLYFDWEHKVMLSPLPIF